MQYLKGLSLKLPGEYNDAFLYTSELYLIDDTNLIIIDFYKLISEITSIKSFNPDTKILCKYAFLNNDFFYKADSDFHDFFKMKEIKQFLLKSYSKIQEHIPAKVKFDKYIIATCKHNHKGAHHLEIYKNTIFISSDNGVSAYKKKLSKEVRILDFPAYQIVATVGNNVYFCCGENKFNIINFSNLSENNCVKEESKKVIKNNAIEVALSYTDMLIKDLNNEYHYQYDSLMFDNIERKKYTPEEKNEAYKEINNDLFKNAKYINFDKQKMLRCNNNSLHLYKIDYNERKKSKEVEKYITKEASWEIDIPKNIYEGYRTVFGYVIDTDKGTYVFDDDMNNNSNHSKPLLYKISNGENLKIRYFSRAINYSHILLNIKNKYVEIYSDLTNYFFPKKRLLRKMISRKFAYIHAHYY